MLLTTRKTKNGWNPPKARDCWWWCLWQDLLAHCVLQGHLPWGEFLFLLYEHIYLIYLHIYKQTQPPASKHSTGKREQEAPLCLFPGAIQYPSSSVSVYLSLFFLSLSLSPAIVFRALFFVIFWLTRTGLNRRGRRKKENERERKKQRKKPFPPPPPCLCFGCLLSLVARCLT